jgi:radical SAM superfamily enzyme with C-terminal helix-hairpin-helix motif
VVTNAYYCGGTPSTPTEIQQWYSANGVSGVSGIIEVNTTTFGSQFQHTVHLKNASLVRNNSSFSLGSDFVLGTFYTN